MQKDELTPESEVCYEWVPRSLPSDWMVDRPLKEGERWPVLKKEAPKRAHLEVAAWRKRYDEARAKGIMID